MLKPSCLENSVSPGSNVVLKDAPDNPSVRKFVEFIEKNAKQRMSCSIEWIKWSNKKKNMSRFTPATTQKKRKRENHREKRIMNKNLRNQSQKRIAKKRKKKNRKSSKNQKNKFN